MLSFGDDDVPGPEVRTTYEYIIHLNDRLKDTCRIAKEELMKTLEVQKGYYDRKCRSRKLSVGDKESSLTADGE